MLDVLSTENKVAIKNKIVYINMGKSRLDFTNCMLDPANTFAPNSRISNKVTSVSNAILLNSKNSVVVARKNKGIRKPKAITKILESFSYIRILLFGVSMFQVYILFEAPVNRVFLVTGSVVVTLQKYFS